jgi:uncharacterized protein YbjT (DUF2867 family)
VVNAILADGTFTPRAITRDVTSDAAQKLKARGVEVVQADLWDTGSLKKAIAGSEGVFGVSGISSEYSINQVHLHYGLTGH